MQPRHYSAIEETGRLQIPWAADNDCFQGLDETAYVRMLDRISGVPGCLFVTVPDVVGDAAATDRLWEAWAGEVISRGLPPAYVLQDGLSAVPDNAAALFVGGTTEFKMGQGAREAVRYESERWTHMGRVNSLQRMRYAKSIGCDSVDGSSFARWKRAWMVAGGEWASLPQQLMIDPT